MNVDTTGTRLRVAEDLAPPRLVTRGLVAAVRGYQLVISPALPPRCRYLPTCSDYAMESLHVHGAGRGSWLATRRLLRCHPFHAGGHDPVPPRVDRQDTEHAARPVGEELSGA